MIYEWKDGGRFNLDAQIVGDRLEALRQRHGAITAETVVSDARKPRSPLRSAFEWDDTTAAHQHRLQQARELIRSVVVIHELDERPPVRAFVTVNSHSGRPTDYQSIDAALSDPHWRTEILARAKRELQLCAARYEHLQELAEVINAIERIAA